MRSECYGENKMADEHNGFWSLHSSTAAATTSLLLLAAALLRIKKRGRRKTRCAWVKNWHRTEAGAFHQLMSYPSCSFSDLATCVLAISLLFLPWYSLFPLSYRHGYLIHSAISREISFSWKLRDFGLFRVCMSAILIASVWYACSFLKVLIDMSASLKVSARLDKNLLHCNRFSESGRFRFHESALRSGVKIHVRFASWHCRADRSGRQIVPCKPAFIFFYAYKVKLTFEIRAAQANFSKVWQPQFLGAFY